MGENFPERSVLDRRLSPPESCALHERFLVDLKEDIKDLKEGQAKSADRVELQLEKHREKVDARFHELWHNGLSAAGDKISDHDTRLTKLEVKDDVEDTFRSRMSKGANESTLKTFIKAVPKEAWILVGVALIMYGPTLITALSTFL